MSHAESTAGSTPRSGVPAEVVERVAAAVAEEASGSKTREALRLTVPQALQRRAAGESYAAIGRGIAEELGVSTSTAAKWVSLWCGLAATIADTEVAAVLAPARASTGRKERRKTDAMISFRPTPKVLDDLRARSAGMSVNQAAEKYLEVGLNRRRPRLDPAPQALPMDALINMADATSMLRTELRREGNNLNQVTRYVHTYRELPRNITAQLTATQQQLERTEQALQVLISLARDPDRGVARWASQR